MGKTFNSHGESVEPGQQDIRDGNVMIQLVRQGRQRPLKIRTQTDEFEGEPQQNGASPDRDGMVRKGKTNVRVER